MISPNSPEEFVARLKETLSGPLPGESAQNRMNSRARISTEEYLKQNPNHRVSAVLLPLYPMNGEVFTSMIRRPVYAGMHSGQLGLPGGKVEETDGSLEETAMREMEEEVGVRLSKEQFIGRLTSLYIPPSNFLVHPFVAWLDEKPEWKPDGHEVDEVIDVSLTRLFSPSAKDFRRIQVGKSMFVDAPCYFFNGQILWGATAMMFSELEVMLEK